MTDSLPRKRAWFQLHLSTCIVLMVAAGVLIGMQWYSYDEFDLPLSKNLWCSWGWPFKCHVYLSDLQGNAVDEPLSGLGWNERGTAMLSLQRVLLNILCCLSILAACAFACEWLIRHRGRAPAPQE